MGKLILVVDDSAVLRASVTFTLKNAGFEIAEAKDGQHGLEVLEKLTAEDNRPLLILSDVNMPIMDGITFIRNVRQNPSSRFVPIIVLSTESEESKLKAGKEAGATGWLVKPFKEDQLTAVVRKFAR